MNTNNWSDLCGDILTIIFMKLENLEDIISFSVVCKSWKGVVSTIMEKEKPWVPTRYPWLLLAEDTGLDISEAYVGCLEAYYDQAYYAAGEDGVNEIENYDFDSLISVHDYSDHLTDERNREGDRIITSIADLFVDFSKVRGLFSLKTGKVYNITLPEATNKVVLGINQGWLVTIGKNLEINLLHPFLRHQILLPPLRTLPANPSHPVSSPCEHKFYDDYYCLTFIKRIAMSSRVPVQSVQDMDGGNLPIVMAIYGDYTLLTFARLGDKSWTSMKAPICAFEDIVYHKDQFYAMDTRGEIYLCDIVNKRVRQIKKAVNVDIRNCHDSQGYLIESLSGSHIWLVVRVPEAGEYCKSRVQPMFAGNFKYHTTKFRIYKFEVQCCESKVKILSKWNEVKDLGNEAIFVGKSSAVSIAATEFIKPNSIYFTDDSIGYYRGSGGGHDMGIYNVETGTVEPHFQGVSIHHFSPSIWYI